MSEDMNKEQTKDASQEKTELTDAQLDKAAGGVKQQNASISGHLSRYNSIVGLGNRPGTMECHGHTLPVLVQTVVRRPKQKEGWIHVRASEQGTNESRAPGNDSSNSPKGNSMRSWGGRSTLQTKSPRTRMLGGQEGEEVSQKVEFRQSIIFSRRPY